MAARGTSVYWDQKKLNALKKLAEKGMKGGAKIDWIFASSKLSRERDLLGDKTDHQLSKSYSRFKHVFDGKCYRCGKKRDDLQVLTCKKCRNEAAKYHKKSKRYFVRKDECERNMDEIKDHLLKKSKPELVDFMTKNINSFTVKQKLELLDKYVASIAQKN